MYLSNEVIESVGKSLVFDLLYVRGAFTNFWSWVIDTWSIRKWNPEWDTTKVWDTTKEWDTKRYDEVYCDVNFLDTDHLIIGSSSHEKIE